MGRRQTILTLLLPMFGGVLSSILQIKDHIIESTILRVLYLVSVCSAERIEISSWKPARQPGWRKASCAGHLSILKVVQDYYLKHGIRLDRYNTDGRKAADFHTMSRIIFIFFSTFQLSKVYFSSDTFVPVLSTMMYCVSIFIYLSTVVQREAEACRHLLVLSSVCFDMIWGAVKLV